MKLTRLDFLKLLGIAASSLYNHSILGKDFRLSMTKNEKMPAIFIGHGSPENGILQNGYTKALNALPKNIPTPKAVLVISAHWLTKGTFVAMTDKPEIIYDFYGFPEKLYQLKYNALGSPLFAERVMEIVKTLPLQKDLEWGLDHGAWIPLLHIYPKANIPVFQMSIDINQPPEYHYNLGKQLSSLRDMGVLVIGSGNIVHNLQRINFSNIDGAVYDWSYEFDSIVKKNLDQNNHTAILNYLNLGMVARLSVPIPDHFYPLLYIIGMQDSKDGLSYFYEGFQHSSISMRCFQIG
ncbi:MAG: 4,5-DOPA dioxygenase extradiol [Leptospiraceae bacterium]|nr:4,5-DOPA dioxygenase extradiol [Leptospiraceae bacterium]